MKKTKSMVMGAAILAALALPMVAGAAGKLVVQDNSTPAVDKFVVTDQGWIGSGLGTGVAPIGPVHVKSSGATQFFGGNMIEFTATGSTPATYWAPNYSLYRNNDVSVNGGLPRTGDALGFFNFGTLFGTSKTNRALIYAIAENDWTSTTNSPAYFQFLLNPGGVTQNREVLKINSNGTMTVNGGIRLYPYTGTTPNPALVPTKPACTASTQGTVWFTKVAGADTLEICADRSGLAWRPISF